MTATLTFTLPDDQQDFDRVCKALDLAGALWDIQEWLFNRLNRDDKLTDAERRIFEEFRDKIVEITVDDHGIDLERLYS